MLSEDREHTRVLTIGGGDAARAQLRRQRRAAALGRRWRIAQLRE